MVLSAPKLILFLLFLNIFVTTRISWKQQEEKFVHILYYNFEILSIFRIFCFFSILTLLLYICFSLLRLLSHPFIFFFCYVWCEVTYLWSLCPRPRMYVKVDMFVFFGVMIDILGIIKSVWAVVGNWTARHLNMRPVRWLENSGKKRPLMLHHTL